MGGFFGFWSPLKGFCQTWEITWGFIINMIMKMWRIWKTVFKAQWVLNCCEGFCISRRVLYTLEIPERFSGSWKLCAWSSLDLGNYGHEVLLTLETMGSRFSGSWKLWAWNGHEVLWTLETMGMRFSGSWKPWAWGSADPGICWEDAGNWGKC